MSGFFAGRPINREIEALREDLAKRRTDRLDKNDSSNRKLGAFWSIVACFLGPSRLISQKSLSAQDFGELEPSLSVAALKRRLNSLTLAMLTGKDKYVKELKSVSSITGLYDFVIKQLVQRDLHLILLLEALYGSTMSLFALGYYFQKLYAFEASRSLKEVLAINFAAGAMIACCLCLNLVIQKREDRMILKTRRALQALVYQKLFVSDIYLLENADNNLIFRLLYPSIDDYVTQRIFLATMIPSCLTILILTVQSIHLRKFEASLVIFFLLIRIGSMIVIEKVHDVSTDGYRTLTFEQRKVLYEYINNFKSFNLKNLQSKFSKKILDLKDRKVQKIKRILFQSMFENLPHSLLITFALLYQPLFYNFSYDPRKASPQTHYSPLERLSFMKGYFEIVYVYLCLEYSIERLRKYFSGHLRYRKSKRIFDKFFDNDYVVGLQGIDRQGVEQGEIRMTDCEFWERNRSSIKKTLDFILSRDRAEEELICRNQKSHTDEILVASRTVFSSKSRKQQKGGKPGELMNPMEGNYRRLCSGLSMHLPKGKKLCIFENENVSIITGFIDAILGENHIDRGVVQISSVVSFYNPHKMHLIIGKTIRDNIVFGQAFCQERYDTILKLFGTQFGNYQGQDFHEVADSGRNLRAEDIKVILFARFLYQDADIYVVQSYFSELNMALMDEQVNCILKQHLAHKTVIFTSNNLDLIKMSDLVLSFESDSEHHLTTSADFVNSLNLLRKSDTIQSKSGTEQKKSHQRVEIIRNKIKNSAFIAHISFEEELEIHKKLEAQKKKVEQIKGSQSQILDLLAFGIYLVHRKRQEGRFLQAKSVPTTKFALEFFWKKLRERSFLKYFILVLFLNVFSHSLYLFVECQVLLKSAQLFTQVDSDFSNLLKSSGIPSIIACLFFGFVLDAIRNVVFKETCVRIFQELNSNLFDWMLNSSIKRILQHKAHTILDRFSRDLTYIELDLPDHLRVFFDRASQLVVNSLVIAYTCSLNSSLVIIGIPVLFFIFVKKLIPVYMKISEFNSTIESKIDDLNFQLLSLIGGYRIAGRSEDLVKKLDRLCDSSTLSSGAAHSGFKALVMAFALVATFLWVVLHGACLICCYRASINWFRIDDLLLIWTSLCVYRTTVSVWFLPVVSFQIVELLTHLIRIEYFLDTPDSAGPTKARGFRNNRPQLGAPIIFKNVSLTSGLQPLLKKVSFRIEQRSKACLFSVEGGGRSNIFELLTQVLDRDPGEKSSISLFGNEVEELDAAVIKQQVFLIERRPALFEGTVRDNIDPLGSFSLAAIHRVMRLLSVSHVLPGFRNRHSKASSPPRFSVAAVRRKVSCYEQFSGSGNRPGFGANQSQQFSRNASSPTQSKLNNGSQQSPVLSCQLERAVLPGALCASDRPGAEPEPQPKASANRNPDLSSGPGGFKTTGLDSALTPMHQFHPLSNTLFIPSINNILRDTFERPPDPQESKPSPFEPRSSVLLPPIKAEIPLEGVKNAGKSPEKKPRDIQIIKIPEIKFKNRFFKTEEQALQKSQQSKAECPVIEQEYFEEEEQEPNLSRDFLENPKEGPQEAEKERSKASKTGSFRSSLSKSKKKSSRPRMISKNIIESSPFKQRDLSQSQDKFDEDEDELWGAEVGDDILDRFLEVQANFEGKNLSHEIKRFVLFCRCLLSKPKLLLVFEESLRFGRGVEHNQEVIAKHLPDSTVIAVTKGHAQLLAYDTLIFLDSGKVIEKGNPKDLIKSEQSFLHRFLKETDEEGLEFLVERLQDMEAEEDLRGFDKLNKESVSAFSAGKLPDSQIAGEKSFAFNMQKCDLFTAELKSELRKNHVSRPKFKKFDFSDPFDSKSKRSLTLEQFPAKNGESNPAAPVEPSKQSGDREGQAVRVSTYKSTIMKRPRSGFLGKQTKQ